MIILAADGAREKEAAIATTIKKGDFDRIEVIERVGGPGYERIIKKAIHNPNMADIGDIFRRLHAAEILEIEESQEFAPVCSGPGYVEDFVPVRNKEIKFVILGGK